MLYVPLCLDWIRLDITLYLEVVLTVPLWQESDNNLLRISKMKKVNINYGKVQPVNKIWLSREEAMCFLGCADDYLRKIRESGQVSFCRDGRMIWYNVNSLQRYIEKHKVIWSDYYFFPPVRFVVTTGLSRWGEQLKVLSHIVNAYMV